MRRIAVLIDGGHVRVLAKRAHKVFDEVFVEHLGRACALSGEDIQRILYYDCAPYAAAVTLPVSGGQHQFTGSDRWLHALARRDLCAVRRGVLKFRGWVPKRIPIAADAASLKDTDFKPDFEQKGVDMRIGLDMANYAANRSIDLISLMTNDTDCIPAMKYARRWRPASRVDLRTDLHGGSGVVVALRLPAEYRLAVKPEREAESCASIRRPFWCLSLSAHSSRWRCRPALNGRAP
ncbi:MAG TPA: NYN domain-containing protein, partial [Vicinamibacterales bacterium]|nr:NYN domain-containing protein [Vicinamibacterales bacterium]